MRKNRPYQIFQIGFNRCGTSSFYHFFNKNGYKAAHWEKGTIAVAMELAKREEKPLLTYCNKYDIYTDLEKVNMWRLPELKWRYPIFRKYLKKVDGNIEEHPPVYAFKYFDLLDKHYPNSKFILNRRDPEKWVESRMNLNKLIENRLTYRSCQHGDNFHANEAELADCWRNEWHQHINSVRNYFKTRPDDLLDFNIEEDSVEKIIDFFPELNLNPYYWQQTNKSHR